MGTISRLPTWLKNTVFFLRQPGRWSRTALILIPVHLVAFAVLFWGMIRLVQGEVLRTHSSGARVMLSEAIHTLHPIMCSLDHTGIPGEVSAFAAAHSLLDLRIYRADGSLIGEPGQVNPEVIEFLEGNEDEIFEFADHDDITALTGISRIYSAGPCTKCHESGALLGAVTMDLDLTPEVSAAHRRLKRDLLFLVGGWVLVVGVVNIGVSAWTRRSLAHIRHMKDDAASAGHTAAPRAAGVMLDPVAAELYRSLTEVLQRQQEDKEAVNRRLHNAERLASLGQLTAGLAHEIKNPLAGIRGVMELMRDESKNTEDQDLFQQVVAELDRVNETIHLLLNFARPSPPRIEATDVADLLEDSIRLLRPSLNKRSISLDVGTAGDVTTFMLDPDQIRHVVNNLVANAADAIEEDGRIEMRASSFPDGEGLIISIRDDGPGIAKEDLGQVFEPFFTTKFSGTGLGLAVVQSLVAQHSGHVDLQSEPGQGATFFVILPCPADGGNRRDG